MKNSHDSESKTHHNNITVPRMYLVIYQNHIHMKWNLALLVPTIIPKAHNTNTNSTMCPSKRKFRQRSKSHTLRRQLNTHIVFKQYQYISQPHNLPTGNGLAHIVAKAREPSGTPKSFYKQPITKHKVIMQKA
jgi:hypothetical protein